MKHAYKFADYEEKMRRFAEHILKSFGKKFTDELIYLDYSTS